MSTNKAMTFTPATDPEACIDATIKWLDTVIIAHNFCPFAKRERDRDSIRYQIAADKSLEACLQFVANEMLFLDEHSDTETSLLLFPEGFADFDDYLELLELSQEVLRSLNYEGRYQIASFHPQYCFEGCAEDDAENYTNRSPYPMLHLLRESSLSRAIDNYDDPGAIPANNVERARATGLQAHQQLLAACYAVKNTD